MNIVDIINAFWAWFKRPKPMPQPQPLPPEPQPVPVTPAPPPPPTNRERVYNLAKNCLGRDIARTQNELGCAEAVSYLLSHLNIAHFPQQGFLSTADFFKWLNAHADQVTMGFTAGDIIISPTGTSKKGAAHGHIGIVANHGIMSNNSMTGLFDEYYTLDKWGAYYRDKLGFPVYFFRIPG